MIRPIAIAALVLMPSISMAQDHSNHGAAANEAGEAASTVAYKAAMDKMHKDMMVDYTGDADIDFMRGMIPHHQGAVDMAKIVLQDGKDPQVKALAEQVISSQGAEIAMMREWLAQHDN